MKPSSRGPMNVAIFASAFHPSLGGVEELVRQLAHEYRRQGMQVIVLVNRWPRSLPAEEEIEGIPVYRLAMRMPEYNLRVRLNYALGYPFARARMLRILRRHRIDLIHVQCVSGNGHYAAIAARALHIPLIVTAQGERTMDAERVYEKSPFLNSVLRRLIKEADQITACSRDTLEDLERYGAVQFGERGSVIYNGFAWKILTGLNPTGIRGRISSGSAGRCIRRGSMSCSKPSPGRASNRTIFCWRGRGAEREELAALARKLRLEACVHFIGRADRSKAVALFRGCDFFVLPSRQEPMGIVNLEAMAAGKAVVASRTGGVPELVIDGETGLLLPPGEPGPLAEALQRMAGDAALRERMGAAGRERVRQFTWQAVAGSYRTIYEKAVAEKGRRTAGMIPAPVPALNAEG